MPLAIRILQHALFVAMLALPHAAAAQRASVTDISNAVRTDIKTVAAGPSGRQEPVTTVDGREYVYVDAVRITSIRDRRASRSYAVWPRITMAKGANSRHLVASMPRVRDAFVTALNEVTQIDWPGPTKLDTDVAISFIKQRLDRIVGAGAVDAIDFMHVEVRVF